MPAPKTTCAPPWRPIPANHQARFDLAVALNAAGKAEEAVDQLLELFRRDREWNDGAAKTQLMTIFDALKPTGSHRPEGPSPPVVDDLCLDALRGLSSPP